MAGIRVHSRTKERHGWKRTRGQGAHGDDNDEGTNLPQYADGSTVARGVRRKVHSDSAQSFGGEFEFAQAMGGFGDFGRSRSPPPSLIEWARRNGELSHDVHMSGDGYSTGTEDNSSVNSLW